MSGIVSGMKKKSNVFRLTHKYISPTEAIFERFPAENLINQTMSKLMTIHTKKMNPITIIIMIKMDEEV